VQKLRREVERAKRTLSTQHQVCLRVRMRVVVLCFVNCVEWLLRLRPSTCCVVVYGVPR
jgi:hypothetical protein